MVPGVESPNGPASEIHACWKKIGVYGDGSCAELAQFVHCRNCPVYSHAGAQLLDRALPPGYRRHGTEHFGREKARGKPGKISALLFPPSTEWLALPTQAFQEVTDRRLIHSLHHPPQATVV